jgi:CheY-like chemotaxis protein
VDTSQSPTSESPSGRGLGWALALFGPAAAAGLGLLLGPLLAAPALPPFLVAIAGAALVGGLGPGLFAALLSSLAVNYWFFPPSDRLGFVTETDLLAQLVFWASSVLTAALCAWSRVWRLRADNEAGALAAEKQADRAELAQMQQELDRAGLENAVRNRSAREKAVLEEAVQQQAARERAALEDVTRRERTVLVADDDPEARQLACHTLESAGFRWLSACDGTEALELLDRYDFPIELALIEAALPDMSGESLADRLTTRHPAMTVLFTSSSLAEELMEQGLLRPGESLVRKPFTSDGLLRTVSAVTEQVSSPEPADALAVSRAGR